LKVFTHPVDNLPPTLTFLFLFLSTRQERIGRGMEEIKGTGKRRGKKSGIERKRKEEKQTKCRKTKIDEVYSRVKYFIRLTCHDRRSQIISVYVTSCNWFIS
jgi:hypothetical protein